MLVVDLQAKLAPAMHDAEAIVSRAATLLDGAAVLGLPVLVTEQYRKGLGETVEPIASRLGEGVQPVEKMRFSACVEPVVEALGELDGGVRRQVIVTGIEAHVCVLQTCLDLLDRGYFVAAACDAIGSRRASDRDAAIARMTQAGVVPTTVESALLEMVREAGTPIFKAMLPVIR